VLLLFALSAPDVDAFDVLLFPVLDVLLGALLDEDVAAELSLALAAPVELALLDGLEGPLSLDDAVELFDVELELELSDVPEFTLDAFELELSEPVELDDEAFELELSDPAEAPSPELFALDDAEFPLLLDVELLLLELVELLEPEDALFPESALPVLDAAELSFELLALVELALLDELEAPVSWLGATLLLSEVDAAPEL